MSFTTPFIHDKALCETDDIGPGTRIWAFAHILAGARIGRDCNICDGVFVEDAVVVGDRVTVKCGVQLWNGVVIEDDVFIGPNATFTNNPFPRSRAYLSEDARTVVEAGASIGANATILPNLRIGRGAMIGAGAVVTRDVPAGAVMAGNPARQLRMIEDAVTEQVGQKMIWYSLEDCVLHPLQRFDDDRGSLVPIECGVDMPFLPKRAFVTFAVPGGTTRGEHANLETHEFIVCTQGGLTVRLYDGKDERLITLNDPSQGLIVPPTIWVELRDFEEGSQILVLASHSYNAKEYIREINAFDAFRAGKDA